jgi:undecaprenyl-diphosphatase
MFIFIITFLQIVLESLPISSSGHLVLLQRILGVELSTEIMCLLNGPTLIMFAFYFYDRWTLFVRHPWRLRFIFLRLFMLGFIAELAGLCALLIGLQITRFFESVTLFSYGLAVGFLITGIGLYSLRWVSRGNYKAMSWWRALVIGAVQGVAVFPGISRLAATLVVGRWLGLAPRTAFLFSCMVQTPILLATFGYSLLASYCGAFAQVTFNMPVLACIVVVAMVIAYFLLWWVERQFEMGKLWRFAYYMVLPAAFALVV